MIFNGVRNRIFYLVWVVAIICFGLLARVFSSSLPPFIGSYLPDTLWALMVFFLMGCLLPKASTMRVAVFALLFAYAIESSQLLTNPSIVAIRNTTFGGLLLGHGFLWSDLVCYAVGVLFGMALEKIAKKG